MGRLITSQYRQKMEVLNSEEIDPNVSDYIESILSNLTIGICSSYEQKFLNCNFENWSFECTNAAISFFEDDACIERGYISLETGEKEEHAWICFRFEDQEYVFDAVLRGKILCTKKLYDEILQAEVLGVTTAFKVKEYLIDCILNSSKKDVPDHCKNFLEFLSKVGGSEYKRQEKETYICGSSERCAPMCYGNIGYTASLNGNKIKKLSAHFYGGG